MQRVEAVEVHSWMQLSLSVAVEVGHVWPPFSLQLQRE
jgi:hypothetical protein